MQWVGLYSCTDAQRTTPRRALDNESNSKDSKDNDKSDDAKHSSAEQATDVCVCVRARRNVCMQMSFRRHILFFWRTRTLGNKVCNLCGQQNVHTRASCVCVVVCEHMQIKMSTKIKVTEKKLVVTSKGTCAAGRG